MQVKFLAPGHLAIKIGFYFFYILFTCQGAMLCFATPTPLMNMAAETAK